MQNQWPINPKHVSSSQYHHKYDKLGQFEYLL